MKATGSCSSRTYAAPEGCRADTEPRQRQGPVYQSHLREPPGAAVLTLREGISTRATSRRLRDIGRDTLRRRRSARTPAPVASGRLVR